MDVARLNFSHGTIEEHGRFVKRLRMAGARLDRSFGILQDLQGPRIRVGELPTAGIRLMAGGAAVFTTDSRPGVQEIPVTFSLLHANLVKGSRILLDDGTLEVRVERIDGRRIHTEVVTGGLLTSHKGMNFPGTNLLIDALTSKDRSDAVAGVKLGVDWIALSFVRSAQDVRGLRRILDRRGSTGKKIKIIAKIEKQEAVDHLEEILTVVDGVMVARGDLGIETALASVPVLQKQIVDACRAQAIPVIVATQLLASMVQNPQPTRAEVSDVANAVIDHADAVMLSAETASGMHPVEAIAIMDQNLCGN
jgi:pyruvate kinase